MTQSIEAASVIFLGFRSSIEGPFSASAFGRRTGRLHCAADFRIESRYGYPSL
jgi:hypothetical protein